jgi:hypothetical protein
MAQLAEFLPYVLPYAAGCSAPLAEQQIRQICIDFCMHVPVVQLTLDPLDLLAGQREYDIDSPPGSETSDILQAWFQGQPLPIVSGKSGAGPWFAPNATPGPPLALRQRAANTFELDRAPAESLSQALILQIATRPSRNSNQIADILFNDYAYGIGQGVVARLLMMPGHSFSNPGMAAYYHSEYLRVRAEARIRVARDFNPVALRVAPRAFA